MTTAEAVGVPGVVDASDDDALLPLREELSLHPGPRVRDGSPSWTLQDPCNNRFYRLGVREFEILSHWRLGSAAQIVAEVNADSLFNLSVAEVSDFAQFLMANNLLVASGISGLQAQSQRLQKHWASWLLHNYLFFRLPLVRPDAFLDTYLPRLAFLFSPAFLSVVLGSALLGLLLIARQWESFAKELLYFFSWQGAVCYFLALILTKMAHELGHAFTAKRFGCHIPTMGVAFLVMWPVLYTDTSEAWKLPSRRQRLAVGGAGMMTELAIAAFASLLWSFLPEGALRSAAFLLATTTWLLTLGVNLNPFMRFDGYFLLSDLLEVGNLQQRSFALARWWLREQLFGFADPPPELLPRSLRRGLVVYAFCTWLYRFFLFLGIALLVYMLFFKLLGLFLFVVEIIWFIALPIGRELAHWYTRRREVTVNRFSRRTLFIALGLALVSLAPWQSRVNLPALLQAETRTQLYAPAGAQLQSLALVPGAQVEAGDMLLSFRSPDAEARARLTELEVKNLRWQLAAQGLESGILQRNQVIEQELALAQSELRSVQDELARLQLRAPFAGTVLEVAADIRPGDWIAENEPLLLLADTTTARVTAYIGESDLGRLQAQPSARFYPQNMDEPALAATLLAVDKVNARFLNEPYLASTYGGDIAVREDAQGRWVPDTTLYRVTLRVVQDGNSDSTQGAQRLLAAQLSRGTLVLEVDAESLLARFWRKLAAVIIRESGLY
ncbi:MAG: HlyD family efflux transporter periplasmic adaptor subunit [Gammaproteobacteria bacterium]|nr:HlyD family efflux transporter periplasmic adaptor subunit [Gammaproteobacteria bacterium]MBT4378864.1 HlyD family efflux transporter periplasmic adaptor subunit [Gammaproteobacteria bacterium]MBT4618357.1 HlyD family efflux transporter periplasmic adaptor subunit [Gammaproteobacteria bacterium]MBT5443138.1 HlyD family efflux transporter periplasmic adaptor subunit [Gammaproteobacteria bacterium]MBT5792211.1 HlyD family efflux transporter periplasmic adaptor subunit [Gammaproteobacteria bact